MKKHYILKSALSTLFILLTIANISAIGTYQFEQWPDLYYSNRISDDGENLWIATSKGIVKYNKQTSLLINASESVVADSEAKIILVSVMPNGNLLYVDNSQGTYIFNGTSAALYGPGPEVSTRFFGLAAAYDSDDELWIANYGTCAPPNYLDFGFPGMGYKTSDYNSSAFPPTITDMAFDSKGNLWMTMYGAKNHLVCLNNGASQISELLKGTREVASLAIDKNDNVWFADENGIHRYNPATNVDELMTNATNSNIPAAQFYANDVDKDGNVWFTSSHYLLRYDGENFKWWNCYGYHEARAIYCDDDAVYVLMQDDTLMKFKNEKFKTIDLTENEVIETSESRGVDLSEYAFGIPVKQLDFNNQSPFTLSFWVNIKEFNHQALGTQFINLRTPDVNQWGKGGGYPLCDWGYIFSTIGNQFNNEENSEGSIDFSFMDPYQSSPVSFSDVEDFEFSEGEWAHVSFTYKYTSNPDMAFYVNGKLVQVLNKNTVWNSLLYPLQWYDEYIIMVGGPAYNRSPLNAYIDKVQFYNKALSQSEIVESMTTPLLSDASLLGYWDFEEGCVIDAEGYMFADNGTIKATMYKILQEDDISCGSQIQSFTFGVGVNPLLEILGVEENIAEEPKLKAFISNGVLYIESEDDITSINIYDSMGRKVLTPNLSPVERGVAITLPYVKGVLIVKVNNEVVKVVK